MVRAICDTQILGRTAAADGPLLNKLHGYSILTSKAARCTSRRRQNRTRFRPRMSTCLSLICILQPTCWQGTMQLPTATLMTPTMLSSPPPPNPPSHLGSHPAKFHTCSASDEWEGGIYINNRGKNENNGKRRGSYRKWILLRCRR